MSKVVCAISGGVDSAVAALLLRERGHNVIGAYMKNWDVRDETGYCSNEEDLFCAEKVCKVLEIPFFVVDFVKEYWTNVFQTTLEEYENGHTPNPDVLCNKHIKFGAFFKYARNQFATSAIATGHYARTSENFLHHAIPDPQESCDVTCLSRNDGFLYKALDQGKDQTFFLNRISSDVVKHTIFPIGGFRKREVKEIACANGMEFVAKRKESMGICFIGLRQFNKFIEDYIPPKGGNFVCLKSGATLGKHNGYFKYTLGQRARLTVTNSAMYVAGKNIHTGDIFVVPGTLHHALFSKAFITEAPHWIKQPPKSFRNKKGWQCGIRVMHREPIFTCKVYCLSATQCLMILDHPLRAVTPGQSAVIYSGFKCLGGTTIRHIGPSPYESRHGFLQLSAHRDDISLWSWVWEKFGNEILPNSESVCDFIDNYNETLAKYRHTISQ